MPRGAMVALVLLYMGPAALLRLHTARVDLNVCPACGRWSDDFAVAADEAVLVCPACGHRRRFTRLPLLALTGPSGAGKPAVAAVLAGRLQQCVVLEQDLLWLPDQLDPADEHRQFRGLWLRLVAALHQNGRPVLLCGTVVPGQLEACPERRLAGQIHDLALTCDDAELEARLRTRPPWRAWTDEKVARDAGVQPVGQAQRGDHHAADAAAGHQPQPPGQHRVRAGLGPAPSWRLGVSRAAPRSRPLRCGGLLVGYPGPLAVRVATRAPARAGRPRRRTGPGR